MVGRVFQAVARGLTMPMAFTIVLLEFPRERRGSAMGLVMLVVGFAPAIGPTLSGVLVQTVGWRMLLGLQLLNTTVGTWGLNALGNDAIQHAQATGNTLNQVAGSLVTAVVVSMTEFGAALAPAGDALAGYESGYHLGFVALLAVALVDAAVVLFCIRERAGAQAARTAQGADARTAGENAPGEKVARNMQPAAAGQTASDGALQPRRAAPSW